jgi:hypothetical protein
MFVSYIITALFMFATFGLCKFGMGFGVVESFVGITLVVALLYVYIFRLARSIWINVFVKYREGAEK